MTDIIQFFSFLIEKDAEGKIDGEREKDTRAEKAEEKREKGKWETEKT